MNNILPQRASPINKMFNSIICTKKGNSKAQNLTIINQGERNIAGRSISPVVNFNNTITSINSIQEINKENDKIGNLEFNNGNIKNSIQNLKTSNIKPIKKDNNNLISLSNYTKNMNMSSILTSLNPPSAKKEGNLKITHNEDKSDKIPISLNALMDSNIQTRKNTNNTLQTIESDKKEINYKEVIAKKTSVKKQNGINTSEIINKETKKDPIKNNKIKDLKSLNVINKNSLDLDIFIKSKLNITEFACCSVTNYDEIKEKIKKHCSANKVIMKDVIYID